MKNFFKITLSLQLRYEMKKHRHQLAAALTAVPQADQDVEEHISKKKRKKIKGEDVQPEPASEQPLPFVSQEEAEPVSDEPPFVPQEEADVKKKKKKKKKKDEDDGLYAEADTRELPAADHQLAHGSNREDPDTLQTETKKNRRRSRNPAAAIEPPVEDAVHPPVQPPVQIAATAAPAPIHNAASATPAPSKRRIKQTAISDDVAADAPGCDVESPHSALVVHGRPSTTAKAAAAASAHRITRISSVTSPQTAVVPPPQQASSAPCINGDSRKQPRPPKRKSSAAEPLPANTKAAPAADADSHSLPPSSMQSLQLVGVGNDVLPTKGSFLQVENDILMAAIQVR